MSARLLPPRLTRRLLATLVLSLLLGAALYAIGVLRYSIPEAVLVALLGGAVLTLLPWVLSETGEGVKRAYWLSTTSQESMPPAAMDYRLLRLRRDLRDAVERDDRYDAVYPVLRELAAERLRSSHDIDLDAEPERARQVLEPQLWRYLSTPPTDTRRRSRSALHTAIEGIEKL